MCECDEGGCYCIIGRWPESSRKCVYTCMCKYSIIMFPHVHCNVCVYFLCG